MRGRYLWKVVMRRVRVAINLGARVMMLVMGEDSLLRRVLISEYEGE